MGVLEQEGGAAWRVGLSPWYSWTSGGVGGVQTARQWSFVETGGPEPLSRIWRKGGPTVGASGTDGAGGYRGWRLTEPLGLGMDGIRG